MALSSAKETSHRNGSEDLPDGLEELQNEETLLEELLGPETSSSLENLGFRAQQLRHHFLKFCVEYNKAYSETKLNRTDIKRLLDTIQSKQEDSIDKFLVRFRYLTRGRLEGQDAIVRACTKASNEDYKRLLLEVRLDCRAVTEYDNTIQALYRSHLKEVLVRFIRRHYSSEFTKDDKVTVLKMFHLITKTEREIIENEEDTFRGKFKSLAGKKCKCTHELKPHTCLKLLPVKFKTFEKAAKDTKEKVTLAEPNNKPGLGNTIEERADANEQDFPAEQLLSEMRDWEMEESMDVDEPADEDIINAQLLQGSIKPSTGTLSSSESEANNPADLPPIPRQRPLIVPHHIDGDSARVETPKERNVKQALPRRSRRHAVQEPEQDQVILTGPASTMSKSKTSDERNENASFVQEQEESNDESDDDDGVLDPMVEMHSKDPEGLAPEVTSGSMAEAVVGRADRKTNEDVSVRNADLTVEELIQERQDVPEVNTSDKAGVDVMDVEEMDVEMDVEMEVDDMVVDEGENLADGGEIRQLDPCLPSIEHSGSLLDQPKTSIPDVNMTSRKRRRTPSPEADGQQPRKKPDTVDKLLKEEPVVASSNATNTQKQTNTSQHEVTAIKRRGQPRRGARGNIKSNPEVKNAKAQKRERRTTKMQIRETNAKALKVQTESFVHLSEELNGHSKPLIVDEAKKYQKLSAVANEQLVPTMAEERKGEVPMIEVEKYMHLSKAINQYLLPTIKAVLKEEESCGSDEARAMIPENLLQTISENLRKSNVAGYYMAVSLLLKHGKISEKDLPTSASEILKPVLKLLDDKSYKPCIHPNFRCKKARCFEQWYVLSREEQHGVASFRQFKARHWLQRERKYSSDFKTNFRILTGTFSGRVIDAYGLKLTLCSDASRSALRGAEVAEGLLTLEKWESRVHNSSKSKQGRSGKTAGQNGDGRPHMSSGGVKSKDDRATLLLRRRNNKRARMIAELKAAKHDLDQVKESIPEDYVTDYDKIKALNKRIETLEAHNAEQNDTIKNKSDRITAWEAAWKVNKKTSEEDLTRLDSKRKREIQKLKDEKETQGQGKDEEIRILEDQLEKQEKSNKIEDERHKSEIEAVKSASQAKLTQHQKQSKESIDKLTEEKEDAQSNMKKQTMILNKWASAAFSYTESRMKWVEREIPMELQTQVDLLRNQINSKDNPDYGAIYESWGELQRNRNLPTIEARIAEVKDELKVKHIEASKGVVEVFRQCLSSISREGVASEEVEMSVDDMINALKSASLDSIPVLEYMRRFFSETFVAKLNSPILEGKNAADVYQVHEPIFLLMNEILNNKKNMQDQLDETVQEHGKCKKTLQNLQNEKTKVEEELDDATKKQNDSISKLNKEIIKLKTDNANQKATIETQVERISTLEQKEAAWDEKHSQEIQKLEDEKQTQGQVSDEEIRNLTDKLEKQKVRNREEEKRHKTEMETAESELQASKAELTKHQEKSKKSIDELTEEKNTAQSNITKQTAMLNKWASAAFSYTESRIEWVKEEKLREKLRELQTLLRNQINSEDSTDYAAIYKSWDELQRNKNLPTIEARIAEVEYELKVKHNGVVGVFRQCLLSISGRVASEEVELPVDDMINLLKSAGLDSKPVLEHMQEFFSQTYLAKLDSNTTKARNAVEVYDIYKPSFLLIDKIWKNKKDMQDQLDETVQEHGKCKETLQNLRKEKTMVVEQLSDVTTKHKDCAKTLLSLRNDKEKVEEQLDDFTEKHKDCTDTLQSLKDAVEQNRESKASDRDALLKQQKQWSEAVKLMEAVHELYAASRGTGQTGSEFSQKTLQKAVNKAPGSKPTHKDDKKAIKDVGEDSDKSDGGSRCEDPEQRIEDCILNGDFADRRMLQHWHSGRCGCEDFLIGDAGVSTTKKCKLNGLPLTVPARNAVSDACLSMWQWIESASYDIATISKKLKDTIASSGHIINMLEQEEKGKEADAKEDLANKTQKDDDLDRNINAIAFIEEQISLIKFVQSIRDKSHNKIVPEPLKSGKCVDRHVIKCLHLLLCGCDVVFPALSETTYNVTQYETCSPNFKDVLPETIVEKAEGGTAYETFYNFLSTKARCCRLEAKCSELETERSKLRSIMDLYQKAFLYCAQLTVEPFNEKEWTQRGDDEPARRQVREAKLAQVWELLTTLVEKTQELNDEEILKRTESYSESKLVDSEKILSQLVGVAEIRELAPVKSELEELKKSDADKVSQNMALKEKLEKHKSIVKFVVSVHDKAQCSNASLTLESNPAVRDWADGKVIEDLHTILCQPDCTRDFSNLKYAPNNYDSCSKEFCDALPENITDESNEEYEPYRVFLAAIAERCELNLKTSLSNAGLNKEIEDLQDQRAKASQVVQSYQTFFLDFAQLVAKPLLAKEGNQSSTEDEDKDRQDKLEQVGSWLETLLEASGMSDDDKLKAPINIGTGSKSTVTTRQVFSLLIRMQEVPILEQRVLNLEAQLQSQDTKLNTLISSWTQHYPRDEDWTAGEIIGRIIEEHKRLLLEGKEEATAGDETTEVKEEANYDQILTEKEAIWRQLQNVEARHTLVCEALRTLSGSRASSQKFTSCLESGYIGTQENIVELHMILSESANVELSGDGSVKDCEDTTCAGAFLHKFLIKPPIKEEDAAPVKWAIDRDISDELFLLRQIQVFWVLKRHLDERVSAILSLCSTQLLQKPKGDPFSALEFVADFKMDCILSVMEYIIYKENREGHGRKNEANDQKVEGAIREKAEFIGMDWDVISARLTTEKRAAPKKLAEQNNRSEKGRSENDNEQKAAKGIKTNALKRPEILIERITAEQLQFQDTKEKNLQFNQELDTLWAVCTRSLWIKGQLPQEDETQTGGKSRTTSQLASITKCISEVAQQLQDVESKCDTQYTTLQEEAGNNAQLSTILTAATWPSNAADYLGRILQKSSALQHMKDLRLELNRAHFMVALKDFNFNGAEGESRSDIETVLQLANDGGIYYEELGGYLRTVATKGEEAPGINSEQYGIVEPNKILLIWDPILRHVLSLRKRYLEQESKTAECSSMIMELYTQCGGHSGTANRGGMDSEDKAHSKIESSTSQLKFLMAWVTDHPSQKQDNPDVNRVQGRHASEEDIQAAIRKGSQGVASFEEILKQSEQVLVGRCNSLEPDTLEKLKNLIKFPPYHGSWAEQLAAQLNLARDIGFSEGWQLEVQRVNLIPTLNNLSLCTNKAKVREAVKELGLSCERLVVIFPVLDCGESLDESNEVFELYKSHYKPKIDETQDSLHPAAMMELRTDCDNEILPDDGSVDLIRTTFEAEDGVNHIDIHEQFAADFLRKFCQDKHIELSNSDIQARIHDQKRIRGQIQSSEQIRAQQIDTSSAVVNMELKIDGIQYSIVDIRPGNGGHYAFEVHDKNKVRQLDKKSLGKILKSGSVDEVKQNRTTIYTALKQALSHDIPKVRPKDNEKEMKLPRMLRFARIKEFSKPDRWHVEYVGGGRAWVSGCTLAGWGLDVCGKMKEMKSQMVQQ